MPRWISVDQLETLVSDFYPLIAGFVPYSQLWAPSDSLSDFRVGSSDLCSPNPDLSLEKISNSVGDELHLRSIKPKVKYIELDAVVGTVQGSTHQSRLIS